MRIYFVWIGLGGLVMFGFGRLLALTQGCTGFCDPGVSTTFGMISGAIAARLVRTA